MDTISVDESMCFVRFMSFELGRCYYSQWFAKAMPEASE